MAVEREKKPGGPTAAGHASEIAICASYWTAIGAPDSDSQELVQMTGMVLSMPS